MVKGLSEDGRRAARARAEDVILRNFTLFASSTEPKAIQTAAAVANGRPISDVAKLGDWIGPSPRDVERMPQNGADWR
jgi:broad specificity phosphatase PhoE